MKIYISIITFCLSTFLSSTISWGQTDLTTEKVKFFETHIRPALVKYCYQCHSVESGDSRGGLLVDTRIGLLQGGDSGAAIVPGNTQESLIWDAINWESYEMPPSRKMPASVIANFKRWIEMGAPDPREREKLTFKSKITKQDIEEGKKHWSFQKPVASTSDSIDKIVSRKLKSSGTTPNIAADPYTLLRRLNYDLVGLPPSPAEIKSFVSAWKLNSDLAVKEKIDELLARPQYGERWGRHWLDVARYAESSGSRNVRYPHAWRYRNYVIDSFNDDTPYNRFISEQIAGDLLTVKTDAEWQENLIATGFLAIGLKHHDQKNPRQFIADMVDEQIDTTTKAVLGLTVSCARCHDHKYDPIPTGDYYALAGIFQSTQTYYGTSRIGQNHRPSELLLLPIADKTPGNSKSREEIGALKKRIAEFDREMMNSANGKDKRNLRNQRNRLATQLTALNPDGSTKSFGMGVQEASQILNASILIAGEVERPAQEVPRSFVQIMGNLNFTIENPKSSGRLELVKALTSKENPLTARVMVNRIWMHLLGKPIVDTPSNFGFSGMKPNNQELLDYLAVKFMEENWSIKNMIREIVMSDTYRRSSQYNSKNYNLDPENKLLWRVAPRPVDAESLRDSMLSLSGRIVLEGPNNPSNTQGERTLAGRASQSENTGGANLDVNNFNLRSVYLPIIRDDIVESLKLFDFPDPNNTSAGRTESIVPTQALYLMNSEFVINQAESMAANIVKQTQSREEQIKLAFLWAYSREATADELKASQQFFREFNPNSFLSVSGESAVASTRARPVSRPGNRVQLERRKRFFTGNSSSKSHDPALTVFCQTLMASARFRILN